MTGCVLAFWMASADVNADDPERLSVKRGEQIAAFLRSEGFLCLRATTLKRTVVRLDGRRTYRVACGENGGQPVFLITMAPGQRLPR